MAILNINTGVNPNDGLGDSIRDAFVKVNSNTDFLEAARVEFASNISTGNLTVNTNLTVGGTGVISGFYTYNGIEIATVGTTFAGGFVANPTQFQSTQDTTANLVLGGVIVDGGLIVKKSTRANVFIANNAVPIATKNFALNQVVKARNTPAATASIYYDYGYQIGIDVNKQLVSQRTNRCNLVNGPYYEPGVIIKDNWVFNHGNKGYEFCGKWTTVKNNVNHRFYLGSGTSRYGLPAGWILTRDGYNVSNQIDDNMSRAMDFGGWNLWMHNNYYNNTGSDPGNDGEGLLIQRHGVVENFSYALTYNRQGPNGESGYIAPYDVH
jgi:hypothetical protein